MDELPGTVLRWIEASVGDGSELDDIDGEDLPSGLDEEDEDVPGEFIDESESEAAPAAID